MPLAEAQGWSARTAAAGITDKEGAVRTWRMRVATDFIYRSDLGDNPAGSGMSRRSGHVDRRHEVADIAGWRMPTWVDFSLFEEFHQRMRNFETG